MRNCIAVMICGVLCMAPLPSSARTFRSGEQHLSAPDRPRYFDVSEASIAQLRRALDEGRTTSEALVLAYLARIRVFDRAGAKLNSIVTLNKNAIREARRYDRERMNRRPLGVLDGIPIVVKDNFDTVDMPTSAGTLALATLQPSRDADMVTRLRQAGAIIIGKTTMHELASGITTVSSLTGTSRNPYDPSRSPGGSSGGTAIAVASSFAAAGIGTDTCGSVRIPAAFQSLFGLRPTWGLLSTGGVVPLSPSQDVPGPLARTVQDLAIMMDAMAAPATNGTEPDASVYLHALDGATLRNAHIGVVKSMFGSSPADAEGREVIDRALDLLRKQGAEVVQIDIPDLSTKLRDTSVIGYEFAPALADYLVAHAGAPVASLKSILELGLEHTALEARLRQRASVPQDGNEGYRATLVRRGLLRDEIRSILENEHLSALFYPTTLRNPPRIDADDLGGIENCQLSATTGLPAIAIPAGITMQGLPVGFELMGRENDEKTLLSLAYAWENANTPHHAPITTPALVEGHPSKPLRLKAQSGDNRVKGSVVLNLDLPTLSLSYTAQVSGLKASDMVALALHSASGSPKKAIATETNSFLIKPQPVVATLLTGEKLTGEGKIALSPGMVQAIINGEAYIQLYSRSKPLGYPPAGLVNQGTPASNESGHTKLR